MSAGSVECQLKVILRCRQGSLCVLQQDELALDAQSFGQVPRLLVPFNAPQRFIDRYETASDMADFGFGERRSAANTVQSA